MMKGKIELIGMEFHAFHGCLPEERRDGNRFLVDFSAVYDVEAAAASDELADALDYGVVYGIVVQEMAVPSNLIEHVAFRIKKAILETWPGLEDVTVSVAKQNPPVAGVAAWSKITL